MSRRRAVFNLAAAALGITTALAVAVAATHTPYILASLSSSGEVPLKSAGPLAFGPDGILFVGDSVGGSIAAIDTRDRKASQSDPKINVQGIDLKIAALVGVTPDQIVINDLKVDPLSKNVYLSAARGRGPDAQPLIVRVSTSGEVSLLSLDHAKYALVQLTDAPASSPSARQNPRMLTITEMQYINGNLMVAGLSNEEWSSALRSIPFPFTGEAREGTTLQIWHSSHGRYETQAPIRTFVPYTIAGKHYILAAYTCTPLVKIPDSSLTPGAQVKGETIADLGDHNQPLDMVPYTKDGHNYILIANSARGVMKLKADNLQSYTPIISPTVTNVAGVPYDTISNLQNVQYLAQLDSSDALILTGQPGAGLHGPPGGPWNLQTIALP